MKIVNHHSNEKAQAGFTLLEMAVIVVLGGILLSFLGATLLTFMRENQVQKTEYRLEKIQEALDLYLSTNGRYPCVANREMGPDESNYGKEDTANCNAGGPVMTGSVRESGVRIGTVPTRSLNLPDEYMTDGWGRKFTYAVTEDLATNQQYQSDGGLIEIVDEMNTIIIDDAHYVVVSHGATGQGAFPSGASNLRSVPCPTNTMDAENCDDSNVRFRNALVNPDSNFTNHYDDYIAYVNRGAPLGIPTGAVIPFYGITSCPVGWTNFTRAEGKFVIGVRSGTMTRDQYTLRFASPAVSMDIQNGDTGHQPRAITPPYLAMTYCEKLPLLEK